MVKRKIVSISIALVLLISAVGLASAGLRVDGAKLEQDIAPGTNLSHVMTVSTRSSDQPMDIRVELLGYGQTLDHLADEVNASQDTSHYTARPFLKVSPNSFHLDPGKSQDVKLEGDIPKDVGSGGRYAIVKIYTVPPNGNKSVKISLAVNVRVLLTISGSNILNTGEIENFSLKEPVSAEKQTLSLILKNTGNHHYKAMVEAVVKDKEGDLVANASAQGWDLLPTYAELFSVALNPKTPLKPGMYNANATIKMEDGTLLAAKEAQFEIKS
jgi:P pilus assembly chaperone PapD